MRRRRVVVLAYEGVQLLDIAGPCDAFNAAARLSGGGYDCVVVSPEGDPVTTSCGATIATSPVADAGTEPVDTMLVPGRLDIEELVNDHALLEAIRGLAQSARRVTSVCTGAFLLAAAGLLDGRQASTHWAMADELQARFPGIAVRADRLLVRDGRVRTSGGVASGVDLALDIIAEDLGDDLARQVAKWLIVPLQRAGGQQSSFRHGTPTPAVSDPAIQQALDLIAGDPAGDHRVGILADRVGFSRRHFARRFREVTGVTPARHVENVRLDLARELLETSTAAHEAIAHRAGFADAESLRQSFQRHYGVSPRDHRRAFNGSLVHERPTTAPVAS